jgi:hypothetical protein
MVSGDVCKFWIAAASRLALQPVSHIAQDERKTYAESGGESMNQEVERKDSESKAPKREYSKPSLVEYGPVSKLIQNGQGPGADGGPNAGMMMPCL